jgi:AcrR family transcriptional regulator
MTKYFAGNFPHFIFSLFSLNLMKKDGFHFDKLSAEMEKRGVSFPSFEKGISPKKQFPSAVFLAGASALLGTTIFCKQHRDTAPLPGELEDIAQLTAERVRCGLDYDKKLIDAFPFEKLESLVAENFEKIRSRESREFSSLDPLLKAVAEAVAEVGPWNASMKMVARLSGLSKSGLYSHFKSKKEMLSRLFMTEFERITETADACSALSPRAEEQLYLVMLSITSYLGTRPEVLIALDWIRIQRLELDIAVPIQLHDFFSGLPASKTGFSSGDISQWILFMIIIVLMRHYRTKENLDLPKTALRRVFRFITLGLEGV